MKYWWLLATMFCAVLATVSNVHAQQTITTTVSAIVPATTLNQGNLRMTGYASPSALVTFLQQGVIVGTTVADSNSAFDKTLSGISPGVKTFSMYGTDINGRTTLTLSFDVLIMAGMTITLSGFLLPPTISVKEKLRRPQTQVSDGMARSSGDVTAIFNSDIITKHVSVGSDGKWQAIVPETFHLGRHTTYALVQDSGGTQSDISRVLGFDVLISADLNNDDKVNLTDFSVLMFSYGRADPPNKAADINDNGGAPDLVDFSVMMFYWTGG